MKNLVPHSPHLGAALAGAALVAAVSLGTAVTAKADVITVTSPPSYGSLNLANLGTSTSAQKVGTTSISLQSGAETISFTNTTGTSPYEPSAAYAGTMSNSNGNYATSPFPTPTSGTFDNYVAAEPPIGATSNVTISFTSAQNGFDLLWGSVGEANTLTFYNGGTKVDIVTGTRVAGAGNPALNLTNAPNAYVQIADVSPFTTIVATATNPAFEFVPGAALHAAPVPEPGSLALLGTALLGLAGVLRFRRRG